MEKAGLIAVDRWTELNQAYFLTHLHADHTRGLSPKWNRGPLFCSPITAQLLPSRFKGFDESLIRVLDVGSTETLSLVSPATGDDVNVLVTAIDAIHCPGAVMFLFRGELGCVLYTGDFRWELNSERAKKSQSVLFDALNGEKVDVLYLDNTYCHPSFSFPSRKDAAQQVLDIINKHPYHEVIIGIDMLGKEHLLLHISESLKTKVLDIINKHPYHDVIIGIDMLGKEHLLLHISESLKTKIWVWPERLETMDLLGLNDKFTTDTNTTRIRAVPRYSLTLETLKSLNTICPTIGIMPTGLPWTQNFPELGAYTIPYTAHSSFSELQEFVNFVKPSMVVGIVSSSFCYVDPRHYFVDNLGGNLGFCTKVHWESFRVMKGSNGLKVRKKEKKIKVMTSVRKSRVNIVRRERIGVKIAEYEEISASDLDEEICASDLDEEIGSEFSS